jgi:hypothetical protein
VDFLYSAANIRCMNYKLTLCQRYKVEQTAFQIRPNLDMISSIPANLCVIDLIKFCTGTLKEQFRVPHIDMCAGSFYFERNIENSSISEVTDQRVSFTGSDVYTGDVVGPHAHRDDDDIDVEVQTYNL